MLWQRIVLSCFILTGPLIVESAADELAELRARIEYLEATQSCNSASPHGWVQADCEPGSFVLPRTSTTVKLGGYVKLDAIYDFQDAGNRFLFDPNTIPIGGGRGEQSAFNARQSRLNLEAVTPTDRGNLRLFVEGDFFTGDNSIRLRHAYGEWGGFLAGQTWVLSVDEDAIPETLDFNGPQGNGNARQPQLRWTAHPSDNITWASSLHDPRNVISTIVPGELRERIPIFTTSLRITHDSGHFYIYGGAGEARFVPDVGSSRQAAVWGSGHLGQLLKERWDLFGARTDLPPQHGVPIFIAGTNGDLFGMLVDCEVQHLRVLLSFWRAEGYAVNEVN